ncbi:uncharacterized protein LOC131311652 [Rhododendron vialii]|uniref:uncharacterized protein LOC131311652 n=1 Tax=Rhododendron vialii TaxID=182163 RepID=UPI00265D7292|nr:uncharacterized protein LOC131311652 [Rhododendron vialii]XP_058195160.1 uncharacterized protein LOC131311652 [Rhododendron vialii]
MGVVGSFRCRLCLCTDVAVRPSPGIRDEFGASIWAASFTASLSRLPLCSVSVCWLSAPPSINDRCIASPHGFSTPSTASPSGVYYLQTAQGEKVICAIPIPGEGNHMTHRPFDTFLEEYHGVSPSTCTLEWNFKFQLAAWLDGIVYYSFLQYSEEGVGSCWLLAHASPVNVVQ